MVRSRCFSDRYVCPADRDIRLVKTQKNGTPWITTVPVFQGESPWGPRLVVEVDTTGVALRNIQTSHKVLPNPTSVAKLMSTSMNLSSLTTNLIGVFARVAR